MSESAEEHIAATIAAVRDGGRRWTALTDSHRAEVRAADRRSSLLTSLLCALLLLVSVVACALTVGPALAGRGVLVPVVVAFFGMSGSLPLYVIASAAPQLRAATAIVHSGQALFLGTALATVVAGVLAAVNGVPVAAAVGIGAGLVVAGAAWSGRGLAGVVRSAGSW